MFGGRMFAPKPKAPAASSAAPSRKPAQKAHAQKVPAPGVAWAPFSLFTDSARTSDPPALDDDFDRRLTHDFAEVPAYPSDRHPIQCKAQIDVGSPSDPLEHEADRVADDVMRMPESAVTRSTAPVIQTKAASTAHADANPQERAAVRSALHVTESGGEPLSTEARSYFEPRFGLDLGGVRVHRGAEAADAARALGAHAYTVGPHIAFAAGQYAPSTPSGKRLLAHELAHTVQQGAPGARSIVQRAPAPGAGSSPGAAAQMEPLDDIAARMAEALIPFSKTKAWAKVQLRRGPVLSVVRNKITGEIFSALNESSQDLRRVIPEAIDLDHPDAVTDVTAEALGSHRARMIEGAVVMERTVRPGIHSEVRALNRAIRAEEERRNRPLHEEELGDTFELSNVWLEGDSAGQAAARCEHCERITRGVSLSPKTLHAEFDRPEPREEIRERLRGSARSGEEERRTRAVSGTLDTSRGSSTGGSGGGRGGASVSTEPKVVVEPEHAPKPTLRRPSGGDVGEMLDQAYRQLTLLQSLLAVGDWVAIKKRLAGSSSPFARAETYEQLVAMGTTAIEGTLSILRFALSKVPQAAEAGSWANETVKMLGKIVPGLGHLGTVIGVVHAVTILSDPQAQGSDKIDALGVLGSVVARQGGKWAFTRLAAGLGEVAFEAGAEEAVGVAAGAAGLAAAGVLSLLVAWFFKGFASIAAAHEAGDRRAATAHYAHAFADAIAAALVSMRAVPQPESAGVPQLTEARRRGHAEAFAFLRSIDRATARTFGEELVAAYRSEENARNAIESVLMARAGYSGLKFHEGSSEVAERLVR